MDIISCVCSIVNLLKNSCPRKPKLEIHFKDGKSTCYSTNSYSFYLTFLLSNGKGSKSTSLVDWKIAFKDMRYEPDDLHIMPESSPQIIDIPDGNARELKVFGAVRFQGIEIHELKGRLFLKFSNGKRNTCEFCVKIKDEVTTVPL